MKYKKILYANVFLFVLMLTSFAEASKPPIQPGKYQGVIQVYDNLEQHLFKAELREVTFQVMPEGTLIFGGAPNVLGPKFHWESDRWIFEDEQRKKIEAIPFVYGNLIVLEYWAYESSTKVGGARLYIVLNE